MAIDDGDNYEEEEPKYDWRDYGDHEQETQSLDGKDVMAIFIAALQTIFLPLVILTVAMLGIGLFIGLFFGG